MLFSSLKRGIGRTLRFFGLRRHGPISTLLLEGFRSAQALGPAAPIRFAVKRLTREYRTVFSAQEPLVSICIATYNCSELLVERAVASCLSQTYQNIEILVVGDCCTDDTAQKMALITDPRVNFENLSRRGAYPDDPQLRWYVAGCVPFNQLLRNARGDFITHLDHDDEFMSDRIELLVRFAQRTKADFIFHPFLHEEQTGEWTLNNAERFSCGQLTTSSVFYHRYFRQIEGDMDSWRIREPGDWNRFRRIRFLRPRIRRYPTTLTRHYKERTMVGN